MSPSALYISGVSGNNPPSGISGMTLSGQIPGFSGVSAESGVSGTSGVSGASGGRGTESIILDSLFTYPQVCNCNMCNDCDPQLDDQFYVYGLTELQGPCLEHIDDHDSLPLRMEWTQGCTWTYAAGLYGDWLVEVSLERVTGGIYGAGGWELRILLALYQHIDIRYSKLDTPSCSPEGEYEFTSCNAYNGCECFAGAVPTGWSGTLHSGMATLFSGVSGITDDLQPGMSGWSGDSGSFLPGFSGFSGFSGSGSPGFSGASGHGQNIPRTLTVAAGAP